MTTIKFALFTAALGLSSLAFAGTKTYNLKLSGPALAGAVQLAPGSYKLNINGSGHVATFTNMDTNQSVMVLVRQNLGLRSFDHTALDLKNENGSQRIEGIELEDSNSTLEF